jgi:hypothetical protein
MNSVEVKELINTKNDLELQISDTKKILIVLEQQKNKIIETLYSKCVHNWKDEGRLHHYDNVSYICLICGLEK